MLNLSGRIMNPSHKLQRVVEVLLVLLFAWFLGKAVSAVFVAETRVVLPEFETPSAVPVQVNGQANYLFGQAAVSRPKPVVVPVKKVDQSIQVSRLNLSLVGLVDMGDRGVALIKQGNKTFVVQPGETFIPNVVLEEILPGEVIIRNRNKQERLLLKQAAKTLLQVNQAPSVQSKASAEVLSSQSQAKLTQISQELRKTPVSISKYIRFKPLNNNGQWTGVKLWAKSDKALFNALGFREGDVLTSVNGKSIADMAKNPSLWQAFLKSNTFDLVVQRKGVPQDISVNLNDAKDR